MILIAFKKAISNSTGMEKLNLELEFHKIYILTNKVNDFWSASYWLRNSLRVKN